MAARQLQLERFRENRKYCNAQMTSRLIRTHCKLDKTCGAILEAAVEKFGFSARTYFRILKIARTIADLSRKSDIEIDHLSEAIQYRTMDRNTAGS